MPRRKPGTLLPLELEILGVASSMPGSFHGFGLAQAMREHSGSRALTSHGTLYKALARLEEAGLLTSSWEDAAAVTGRPRRRLYELTGKGAAAAAPRPATARRAARRSGAGMRAERIVRRWVRLYTRGLPGPIAERRIEEIDADLHDHIAHERARGTSDRRTAAGITGRMLRGVAADASWRGQMSPADRRSVTRVAAVTTFILLIPLVAMQFTDEVVWGVFDFIFMGALLATSGLLLEYAVRNPGNVVLRVCASAIAVFAIFFGAAADAPGLTLFGFLLLGGTAALTLRARRRSA